MTTDAFPEPVTTRPTWLITLADLALLLVGFLVLLQATQLDRGKLAAGLREGFKADPSAMPVGMAAVEFATASATSGDTAALLSWASDAARDPRVALTVTGVTDGGTADVDPATGSAAVLAADRARAVAATLARALPHTRLSIATTTRPGRRAALVTIAFAGDPKRKATP